MPESKQSRSDEAQNEVMTQPNLHLPSCGCGFSISLELRTLVMRDARKQYAIHCTACDKRGDFISKHDAQQIAASKHMTLDDIPIDKDNRCDSCAGEGCNKCSTPCERCGSYQHIEHHHWAPRHLFDDADAWPTSNLCRECHVEWHQAVTPDMNKK
jgi:RecJ-like exonuclease